MTLQRRARLARKTRLRRTPMKRAKRLNEKLIEHLKTPVHPCIQRATTRLDPEVRFWAKVSKGRVPEHAPRLGPCLIHRGADNGKGYVQFTYNGRGDYAHRYAWERAHGPIPDDLTVDHLCEVKRCVNVEHFTLATRVDNYLRTQLAKLSCPNGHEYEPGTFRIRRGARECLICKVATSQRENSRRVRIANGLPDRRARYDQTVVREVISEVRRAETTIAQGARRIGCNPNYLGRRVWRETRSDVLERDQHTCLRCGDRAQDVHHRVARGQGGSSRPAIAFGLPNLVSLCRACHEHIESNRREALAAGWLVQRGTPPESVSLTVNGRTIWLTDEGTYAARPAA